MSNFLPYASVWAEGSFIYKAEQVEEPVERGLSLLASNQAYLTEESQQQGRVTHKCRFAYFQNHVNEGTKICFFLMLSTLFHYKNSNMSDKIRQKDAAGSESQHVTKCQKQKKKTPAQQILKPLDKNQV